MARRPASRRKTRGPERPVITMNFESFFNPKSVAIVGASRQKGKVGYEILANMIAAGYQGRIFPVNPRTDMIEGIR